MATIMLKYCIIIIFFIVAFQCSAQKYVTEKGKITFFSDAVIEDITAENTKAISMLNIATQDIVFSVPIQEFQFDKKLMQEHFNTEKYMHSEKFPKATFAGKLLGFDTSIKGVQPVTTKGKFTIHGVTLETALTGTAESINNTIILKSKFIIKLADYKIQIPQLVWQNIAEQVEVSVDFTYKPK